MGATAKVYRRPRQFRIIAVGLLVHAVAVPGMAQDVEARGGTREVRVLVLDSASGAAIRGARVELLAIHSLRALSDSSGGAVIPLVDSDSVVVRVSHIGFRPQRGVRASTSIDSVPWTFALARLAPPTLAEVTVTDSLPRYSPRLADFEHRRSTGRNGTFLTRAVIEKRQPVNWHSYARSASRSNGL